MGEVQATLANDGTLSGLWILSPGHGYVSGSLSISAPDRAGGVQATGTFTATSLTQDTALAPTFRYRSGFYELPNDSNSRDGGSEQAEVLHFRTNLKSQQMKLASGRTTTDQGSSS